MTSLMLVTSAVLMQQLLWHPNADHCSSIAGWQKRWSTGKIWWLHWKRCTKYCSSFLDSNSRRSGGNTSILFDHRQWDFTQSLLAVSFNLAWTRFEWGMTLSRTKYSDTVIFELGNICCALRFVTSFSLHFAFHFPFSLSLKTLRRWGTYYTVQMYSTHVHT